MRLLCDAIIMDDRRLIEIIKILEEIRDFIKTKKREAKKNANSRSK